MYLEYIKYVLTHYWPILLFLKKEKITICRLFFVISAFKRCVNAIKSFDNDYNTKYNNQTAGYFLINNTANMIVEKINNCNKILNKSI